MSLSKKVLYLECIPKKYERNEGTIIHEFVNLMFKNKVYLNRVRSKIDLFKKLKDNRYKYIHISCHGEFDENDDYYMEMPKGKIYPDEFDNKSGIKNRICFISACSLGKKSFVQTLYEEASPHILIAPQRDIFFVDSAVFWIILYYNHFYLGKKLLPSYNIAKKQLKSTGAMKYWYIKGVGRKY